MQLTGTQPVLLSAASQRQDGAIVLAPDLKGSAASKAGGKLMRGGLIEDVPAGGSLPVWCRDDDAGPLARRISGRGLVSIGVDGGTPRAAGEAQSRKPGAGRSPKNHRRPAARRKEKRGKPPQEQANAGRSPSKQARVLAMLKREQGTTIAAIMTETGWQQHSLRGFLAGVVRKQPGLTLKSGKNTGGRVYRVAVAKRSTPKAKRQAAGGEAA